MGKGQWSDSLDFSAGDCGVLGNESGRGRARERARGGARARTSWYPLSSGLHAHDPVRVHPVAESCSGPEHGLSGPPRRFLVPSTAAPRGASVLEPCGSLDRLGSLQPANEAGVLALERRLPELRNPTDGEKGRRLPSVPNTAMIASSRPPIFTLLASSSTSGIDYAGAGGRSRILPPRGPRSSRRDLTCTPPRGDARWMRHSCARRLEEDRARLRAAKVVCVE